MIPTNHRFAEPSDLLPSFAMGAVAAPCEHRKWEDRNAGSPCYPSPQRFRYVDQNLQGKSAAAGRPLAHVARVRGPQPRSPSRGSWPRRKSRASRIFWPRRGCRTCSSASTRSRRRRSNSSGWKSRRLSRVTPSAPRARRCARRAGHRAFARPGRAAVPRSVAARCFFPVPDRSARVLRPAFRSVCPRWSWL